MFKINNVSFESPFQNKKHDYKIEVKEGKYVSISPQIALSYGTVNSSLISFKGLDYYKTLSNNYFKLPETATPDEYQKDAAEHIYKGEDVLVTAPTGTGKTAIAYYAISKNMEDGKKTFYTTPLKALSNEKYKQLQKIYGEENVGLLTGDIKINRNAPIIVMTTEIYRNMMYGKHFKDQDANSALEGLKTVIFDELHYLGDVDRGGVWEQSIILSDKNTQLLSLSATIGNNDDITDWMSKIRDTQVHLVNVPKEKRHVPLKFHNIPVIAKGGSSGNSKKAKQKMQNSCEPIAPPPNMKGVFAIVKTLNGSGQKKRVSQLPAIFFVFSKNESEYLLKKFTEEGITLNTPEEQVKITDTIKKYNDDGKYLGESLNVPALLAGYAIHNAGLLPTQKELIEELFQKKLVKVVIATETLSAGINMPAKSVVITSNRKPTSITSADGQDGKRALSINEFHQMAGRAGRRGIDDIGYVYTLSTTKKQASEYARLIGENPNEIKSYFSPDYSFVAGYYRHTKEDDLINEVLSKSLHCYDKKQGMSDEKADEMMNNFKKKKAILKSFEYINNDNSLTYKGELLSLLNGYHQIPIVETIFNKDLGGLSAVELAACVGTMANVAEKRTKDEKNKNEEEKVSKEFEHTNSPLQWFVNYFDGTLNEYNNKMLGINSKHLKIEQNSDVAKHLYDWAEFNSNSDDSRENWKTVYNKYLHKGLKNEGGLFREITQTVDLLKQMTRIADLGYNLADNDNDKAYYLDLKSTIKESLKLLANEPVPGLGNI